MDIHFTLALDRTSTMLVCLLHFQSIQCRRNVSKKKVYKNTTKECHMIWHFGTSVQNDVSGRSEALAFYL